jgi:hypothetical protein
MAVVDEFVAEMALWAMAEQLGELRDKERAAAALSEERQREIARLQKQLHDAEMEGELQRDRADRLAATVALQGEGDADAGPNKDGAVGKPSAQANEEHNWNPMDRITERWLLGRAAGSLVSLWQNAHEALSLEPGWGESLACDNPNLKAAMLAAETTLDELAAVGVIDESS